MFSLLVTYRNMTYGVGCSLVFFLTPAGYIGIKLNATLFCGSFCKYQQE